jgi:hypothetical protein
VANRKQQKRRYQRAVGRGRVWGDQPAEAEEKPGKRGRSSAPPRRRGEPPTPSATRAAKRAGVFAVLFYILLAYTSIGSKMSPAAKLFNGVMIFVLMWSIGTITETFAWRRWQKRHGGES